MAVGHRRANSERVAKFPFGYRLATDAMHRGADPAKHVSHPGKLKAASYTTRQDCERTGPRERVRMKTPGSAPGHFPMSFGVTPKCSHGGVP
jgi:hypothetical protein